MVDGHGIERIYLDVETWRPDEGQSFVRDDIILIGMLHEEEEKPRLFENFKKDDEARKDGEREVLKDFYKYLKALKDGSHVEVVGFGILRFDVPLLIAKSLRHRIVNEVFSEEARQADGAEFISHFWHEMYVVDLLQALLPFNGMVFKGLNLENAVQRFKERCREISFVPPKKGGGVAKLFKEGRYEEIKAKNEEDLKATRWLYRCLKEELYKCLRELFKKTGQKA